MLVVLAGKVFDDWQAGWEERLPEDTCEGAGLIRSCFGDCVEGMAGGSCHWNPELACPTSDCDEDVVSLFLFIFILSITAVNQPHFERHRSCQSSDSLSHGMRVGSLLEPPTPAPSSISNASRVGRSLGEYHVRISVKVSCLL